MMGYILKEDVAEMVNSKFKNSYISNELQLSGTYVSLIIHRKRPIPKRVAYAFTKVINSEAEIEDMFELID